MGALWLSDLRLLDGPGQAPRRGEALIGADGTLLALDDGATAQGRALGLQPRPGGSWLLAPTLVDPHSVLETPLQGRAETLTSLAAAAAAGGYGTVALLPWATPWRDSATTLQLGWPAPQRLLLWGSFALAGQDGALAPHHDQIAAGAVGLAGGPGLPPLALLERGLTLAEWGEQPLLLAPRRADLSAGGFVRESVETLRAGWPPDPAVSERLPLELLASLVAQRPVASLVLMNLSTAAGVAALRTWPATPRPAATVHWWQLVADVASLAPGATGWRLEPSLGGPADRQALLAALEEGLISAVAVHHQALDREEQLLPLDQRRPGLAGHGSALVLSLLWRELVHQRGWPVERLWQVLSWQPARLLGQEPDRLEPGSRRWLLFDPDCHWTPDPAESASLAANLPGTGQAAVGRIRACGLSGPDHWRL